MAGILKCAGETISFFTAPFQLDQGATWAATCRAVLAGAQIEIVANLVKIGASATAGKDDYTLTLEATSAVTATWNSAGGASKTGAAEIVIQDTSSPPIVAVTQRLSIEIRAPLAPPAGGVVVT